MCILLFADFEWSLDLDDTAVGNDNIVGWLITSIGLGALDLLNNVHTFNNFSKHDMLAIEPLGLDSGDEELRAVGVLAGVGHAEEAWRRVLQLEVLVGKLLTIDTSATSAIASGKVATLDHKVGDDTMELGALVALASWLCGQLSKVFNGLWHSIAKETDLNAASLLSSDGDIEEDLLGDGQVFGALD